MNQNHVMSALYDTHAQAEHAVAELQASGYDMTQLSIVGQEYHTEEKVLGYYNMGDRMLKWGGNGAFWGSMWGMLFGSAFILIPGVGPLLLAGPLVGMLVGALEGAVVVGGVSALGAALASIGIPENSVLDYETEIKAGKFLLLAHGTAAEVARAREILGVGEFATL
jgi:uncharacterized membrane protein